MTHSPKKKNRNRSYFDMSEEVRYDKLGRRIPVFDRKAAGKKTAETVRKKYGDDHYKKIRSKGGKMSTRGYFGKLKEDGNIEELREIQRRGAKTTNETMRLKHAEENGIIETKTNQEDGPKS